MTRSFVFNGDNKQTEVKKDGVTIGRYFYDGEGKRVKKITNTQTTIFVYSSGKLVAEYSTQLSQTPSINYTTTDHLGSPRIITDAVGTVKSRRDFMPFGEEIYRPNYGSDSVRQKFTGYERDNESGLDYAKARMFNSGFGRFSSPDPTLLSLRSDNPQTLNRYSYVLNNPLIYMDPLGLWEIRYRITYKTDGKDKDGKPIFATDKNGNKIVTNVQLVAYKTQKNDKGEFTDDGASLAKQLGLEGDEAKALASQVGDQDKIRFADLGNSNVTRVYETAEKGILEQMQIGNETREAGSSNCAGTASYVGGHGGSYGQYLDPGKWEKELKNGSIKIGEDKLAIGDTALYEKNGKGVHYANFLLRNDAGVPVVFSKSGAGAGPYQIKTAPSLEGVLSPGADYGKITGWYRKK